jgi:DNA-binding NtrC family response regulator
VKEASKNLERDLIAEALERVQWNRRQAARELQISGRSLRNKMRRLGLSDSADSQHQTGVV